MTDLPRNHAVGSPAYTSERQIFHTDNEYIVSLLALEGADEGGQSKIVSSWHIYNTLVETMSDLIRTISEDWSCYKYVSHKNP